MKTNSLAAQAAKIQGNANLPAKTEKKVLAPSVVVGNMLTKYQDAIKQALPSVLTPERFTRIATNVIAGNPKLMQAVSQSPQTLIAALMNCAQLGIEPNTPLGQGFILPYLNKDKNTGEKVMQCQFQLGYQGVMDLCYRSGDVTLIQAHTIYSKDKYRYELGLNPILEHKPFAGGDRGDPIAFYATFKLKNGDVGFGFMYYDEVVEHAKRFSKAFDYGPWQTDFIAMAKKTVILKALKYAPKKSEFARQLLTDSTTKSTISADMTEVPNDDFIEGEVIPPPQASAPAETSAGGTTPASAAPAAPAKPASAPDGELDLSDVK